MWTVLDAERVGRSIKCVCDCGTERMVIANDLRTGKSKGCGCTRFTTMRAAQKAAVTTHGKTNTRAFRIWTDMRRRCSNPKRPDYRNYGARGVTVCERWRDGFENFLADMGEPPPKHTLERKDNDGHYTPENCEWRTMKEQLRNTRVSRMVTIRRERMTAAAAAEKYGIDYNRFLSRLRMGWSAEKAATTPIRSYSR